MGDYEAVHEAMREARAEMGLLRAALLRYGRAHYVTERPRIEPTFDNERDPMKICKDCRHFLPTHKDCGAPQLGVDPVMGGAITERASMMRTNPAKCGSVGTWFEARTDHLTSTAPNA